MEKGNLKLEGEGKESGEEFDFPLHLHLDFILLKGKKS